MQIEVYLLSGDAVELSLSWTTFFFRFASPIFSSNLPLRVLAILIRSETLRRIGGGTRNSKGAEAMLPPNVISEFFHIL